MEIKFFLTEENGKTFAKYEKSWKIDVPQSIGGKVTVDQTLEYPEKWMEFVEKCAADGVAFEPIPGAPSVPPVPASFEGIDSQVEKTEEVPNA